MKDFIGALTIACILGAISFGDTAIQYHRYKSKIVVDVETGCNYLGTAAGGFTIMRNPDGSVQCEVQK